nr:CsiV family protein [Enterovibrio nigricans]
MKKLIFLLLCTLSLPTKAERWFDVEVIVFKRNQDPTSVQEKWPETQPNINVSNAVSVFDSVSLQKQGLQLLPQSDWKLNAEYQKLANHAGFKPLVHVAWRQNDGGRGVMPKLRFTAGQDTVKTITSMVPRRTRRLLLPRQILVTQMCQVMRLSVSTDFNAGSNANTATAPIVAPEPVKESGPMYELDASFVSMFSTICLSKQI